MKSMYRSQTARRWRLSDHVRHAALAWRLFRGRLTSRDAGVIKKLADDALGDHPLATASEDQFLRRMADSYNLDLVRFEIARRAFRRVVDIRRADDALTAEFYAEAERCFAARCGEAGVELVTTRSQEAATGQNSPRDMRSAGREVAGAATGMQGQRGQSLRGLRGDRLASRPA